MNIKERSDKAYTPIRQTFKENPIILQDTYFLI